MIYYVFVWQLRVEKGNFSDKLLKDYCVLFLQANHHGGSKVVAQRLDVIFYYVCRHIWSCPICCSDPPCPQKSNCTHLQISTGITGTLYPPEAVISIQTACPDIYPRRVFQDLSRVSPLPYLSVRRRPKGWCTNLYSHPLWPLLHSTSSLNVLTSPSGISHNALRARDMSCL